MRARVPARRTVVRPAVLFGEDDNFVNMFAGLIALAARPAGVRRRGETRSRCSSTTRPEAIANALADPAQARRQDLRDRRSRSARPGRAARAHRPQPKAASARSSPCPTRLPAVFAALPGTPLNSDQWTLLKQRQHCRRARCRAAPSSASARPLGLFLDPLDDALPQARPLRRQARSGLEPRSPESRRPGPAAAPGSKPERLDQQVAPSLPLTRTCSPTRDIRPVRDPLAVALPRGRQHCAGGGARSRRAAPGRRSLRIG